ncbi:type II secretion system protein N [Diaphorobacter aerolatus]|uniref:Type II secretion system protein N n=1 Tax=Diaphorobacter aerolatus TaxID=1288495 RepID=A0A7H0GNM6_9BURK|nr:type II secretion system protein N [Diaphorobacter aerolatus]QNP49892.1 type II secretion system protein N [Diaphorobacter aerolatus]
MARKQRTTHRPASAVRSPRGWALLGGLLGGLTVFTLTAPATWLASGVNGATNGQVQLQQARGTLWNGSAQLVLTGGAGSSDQVALPGRLNWQLRPAFVGANVELNADCCTTTPVKLHAALQWNGMQLKVANSQSQWPSAVLSGLGTPWNTIQPQGRLSLQTTDLQITWNAGRMAMQGDLQLDALDVSSKLSTLNPMGSYRVSVRGGDSPTLALSTLSGALLLNGSGQWVGQRLRFTGEARAAPGREAALANLLNIIGRRTGDRSILTVG